jgi:hypothetical protein
MRRPHELDHAALATIVARLQSVLYLDRDDGGPFWNLDKEWQSVDMLVELAEGLQQYDLIPDEGRASA